MAFLHGVETITVQNGSRPINLVRTSIIGLVGIAPIGTKNALIEVTSSRDAVDKFGKEVPGFNIPKALSAIFAQGAGRVLVSNVFDAATMTTEVEDESRTIVNGKAKLTAAPIGSITLTNNAGDETFVAGTDYSVDEFGNIVVLDFDSIAEGSIVKATFDKLDATAVTDNVIIGTNTSGSRTGFKLFAEAYSQFGYFPKILICPDYCENDAVAAEMISQAEALRAITLIDAPAATTPANAKAGRGPAGTLAGFKTSSKNVVLLYPQLKVYDEASDATEIRPYSPFFAGVMAATDNATDGGYWVSPSNREIKGITGVERTLTARINDSTSEVNDLNSVGITTYFNSFGTGIRTFGNRSAAYPTVTSPDNFIPVHRVKTILDESVEYAMLQFLDRPINNALIDSIKESVNAFIRSLIQRGALVDGFCEYNPNNNPAEQVAAGQLVFEVTFMPPTPLERITFNSFIDINLLSGLGTE